MSQQNMELSRAFIDELVRAGQEGLDPEATVSKMAEFWDPEVVSDASAFEGPDIGGVYRGIDAVGQFWRDWFAAWEALQFECKLVDAGDRVVMLVDLEMRGRSTGIPVSFGEHAWVNTFKDGLIVHGKLYMSHSEALEAVGLRE